MIKAVIFDMFETLITHYQSPLYFGAQMAEDAGIDNNIFQQMWAPTDSYRTTGLLTLEDTLKEILTANGRYSEDLLNKLVSKRKAAKRECFKHLHFEIIPMLEALKQNNLQIGLISNCFSEEVAPIKESELYPYFDMVCLSFEQGVQKPDDEIFLRCLKGLNVNAGECLYIGDGGSFELEAAARIGMYALQAVWYIKDSILWPENKKDKFRQLESPLEVLAFCI